MTAPLTKLLLVPMAYCTFPMLWMDFHDGKPFVMPQQWIASPPRIPHGAFDPAILRWRA